MAAAHLQNGRILRFLIVLGAVILTIFIYASYYSNIPLGIPPHIRTSSSALLSSSSFNGNSNNNNNNNNNHIEFDLFNGNGNKQQQQPFSYNESNTTVSKKNRTSVYNNNNNNSSSSRHHHYQHQSLEHQQQQQMSSLLVVDGNSSSADNNNNNNNNSITNSINAIGDGELSSLMSINLNERNQSKVNLTNFNRNETKSVTTNNTAHFNASKINKTKEEEEKDERMRETRKHVPPSSLQKLIQNADKVLSNLTAKVSASAPGAAVPAAAAPPAPAAAVRNPLPQQQQSSVAQPPSAVMPANRGQPSSLLSTTNGGGGGGGGGAGVDTTQGIPTKQIYESGHMDGVNPMLCPNEGKQLKLLILITSAETHREARKAIRRTWGSQNGTGTGTGTGTASPLTNEIDHERSPQQHADFAIAFMLGRSTNTTLEMQLEKENQIHGDLIRGHFIDSYNNLTLKTISAIEWVDRNCQYVKHILKTDDDMFINVAKLMKFLDKHQKEKRIIYGRLARKWKPIRNRKSKYFVSIGQFSSPTFPTFTTGPAYVMSSDIIHDLYVRSLQQTYLKLEDVFMTGIIAQQLGIKRVHINEFRNQRIAFTTCSLRKAISVHMVKPNEQFDLWKKLQNRNEKCK